ncbi:MAG: M48 family metallopeptidase [Pseudomonadota bacterium]
MNFFEAQDRSRRNTRWLVVMFGLATILIVVATTTVIELGIAALGQYQDGYAANPFRLLIIAAAVAAAILLASALRIAQLGGGGSKIAQEMGGTLVSGNTTDLKRRRLLNVVEEMAIASGVPVPQVFVLEHEAGINAFAAGFTTADAAVAVTRGTLETLNRAELQGVIAHEFSHILNGDMRLNLRLVGVLFGIIVLGQIGRLLMRSSRGVSHSRNSRQNGNPVIFVGIALAVIGAIGVLMARLIRAGVSRQREYLADASAVQFTRQTEGIAGALAKIGAAASGSRLTETDGEQISHMLFANGIRRSWLTAFASHPPLRDRIKALDPALAQRMDQADWSPESIHAEPTVGVSGFAAYGGQHAVAADTLAERIGRPDDQDIAVAVSLRAALPANIEDAAHSPEWAFYLALALATTSDDAERRRQLQLLEPQIGTRRVARVDEFAESVHELGPQFRLPIVELCFPALKERPSGQIRFLLDLIDSVIATTSTQTLSQYALRQLLEFSLDASLNPSSAARRTRNFGQKKTLNAAAELIVIVAANGRTAADRVQAAAEAGLQALDGRPASAARDLEESKAILRDLQGLIGRDLHRLLRALLKTIAHDGVVTLEEAELMRLICAALDCPLPPIINALPVNQPQPDMSYTMTNT